MRRFRKKENKPVTAIKLAFEFANIQYVKWGATQNAKVNDYIVQNGDSIYTVDGPTFESTYTPTGTPCQYVKTAVVYAEPAAEAGSVQTREGESYYEAGDYLVSNNERMTDRYKVSKNKFETMYEEVTEEQAAVS